MPRGPRELARLRGPAVLRRLTSVSPHQRGAPVGGAAAWRSGPWSCPPACRPPHSTAMRSPPRLPVARIKPVEQGPGRCHRRRHRTGQWRSPWRSRSPSRATGQFSGRRWRRLVRGGARPQRTAFCAVGDGRAIGRACASGCRRRDCATCGRGVARRRFRRAVRGRRDRGRVGAAGGRCRECAPADTGGRAQRHDRRAGYVRPSDGSGDARRPVAPCPRRHDERFTGRGVSLTRLA
jgi:hypothetical protein